MAEKKTKLTTSFGVEDLFNLIQNLDKQEKINFKQFLKSKNRKQADTNYLTLFDYLDKQQVFDKEKVLKYFKGTYIAKYFSIVAKYLYDIIIESIEAQEPPKGSTQSVLRLYNKAIILEQKKLYTNALQSLTEAFFLCEQYQLLLLYPLLLFSIIRVRERIQKFDSEIPKLYTILEDKSKNILLYSKVQHEYSKLRLLMAQSKKNRNETTDENKIDEAIFTHGLKSKDFSTRESSLSALTNYHFHLGSSHETILSFYSLLFDDFNADNLSEYHERKLLLHIYNYCVIHIENNLFDELNSHILKLHSINCNYTSSKIDQIAYSFKISEAIYFKKGEISKALTFSHKWLHLNNENAVKFKYQALGKTFPLYNFINAANLFLNAEYLSSKKEFLDLKDKIQYPHGVDFLVAVRIYLCFIYLELNDIETLIYHINSSHYHVEKSNFSLKEFEKKIMNMLKNAIENKVRINSKELYGSVLQLFESILNSTNEESKLVLYDNLKIYLSSKVIGETCSLFLKSKAENEYPSIFSVDHLKINQKVEQLLRKVN